MVHGRLTAVSYFPTPYSKHSVRMYLDMFHLLWTLQERLAHGMMRAMDTSLKLETAWLYSVIIILSLVTETADIPVRIPVLV